MATTYYIIGTHPVIFDRFEHYETVKALDWETGKFSEHAEYREVIDSNPLGIVEEITCEAFEAYVESLLKDTDGNTILRVNENDLTLANVVGECPLWEYKGELFNGILMEQEKDGSLAYEQVCKNGFEDGLYRSFHPNGRVDEQFERLYNQIVPGTYKQWDEAGNLISER